MIQQRPQVTLTEFWDRKRRLDEMSETEKNRMLEILPRYMNSLGLKIEQSYFAEDTFLVVLKSGATFQISVQTDVWEEWDEETINEIEDYREALTLKVPRPRKIARRVPITVRSLFKMRTHTSVTVYNG